MSRGKRRRAKSLVLRPQNAPSSGAKEAEESCRILEEYGIDLNSAANGVFLPYKKNEFVTTEAMHSGGHSRSYHNTIRKRLSDMELNAIDLGFSREQIKDLLCIELQEIRSDLLRGILKVHN